MKRFRGRPKEEGVASTVGTIMALLVFLTFLSLIVNQYVPVWMKDSESAHMNVALGQFSSFKSSVDLQLLSIKAAQDARRHHVPITSFSPVTLGIDGVPIFSSPTFGTLDSVPSEAPWSVEFRKLLAGVNYTVSDESAGVIRLSVPNRYFVPQNIIYENGGVIRSQQDGQFVRVEPPFEVDVDNQSAEIGFVLFSLFGESSITGTTTEGIHHKVIGDNQFDHTNLTSDVWINATSRYGLAWYNFFNTSLGGAYDVDGGDFDGNCSSGTYRFCRGISGNRVIFVWVDIPYYRLETTWNSGTQDYTFRLRIKNDWTNVDPVVPRLDLFSLEHGFANTVVGSLQAGSI